MIQTRWLSNGRNLLRPDHQCSVMGIINVTPDSFSDGGLAFSPELACNRAKKALSDGADILDIGGESTRPGSIPIDTEEEWRRIGPVLQLIRDQHPEAVISVDTSKPEIARRALSLGASIINDITGLSPQSGMANVLADSNAALVIMHMQGTPANMQANPQYNNVLLEVLDFLHQRLVYAQNMGISPERIAIDPGIGFGKTLEHNLAILQNLPEFHKMGCAVLIGTSRKRMIGDITGRPVDQRQAGSVASALHAATHGANIVRVHDVAATVDALRVWHALETGNVSKPGS